MALEFIDPLGYFQTTATIGSRIKYVGNASWTVVDATGGRWGGPCIRLTLAGGVHGGIGWDVAAADTKIVQIWLKLFSNSGGGTPCPLIHFLEGTGQPHTGLFFLPSTGALQIRRGAIGSTTQIGSDLAYVPAVGVGFYVKMKVKVHDSAGTVDIVINNTVQASLTGQDTQNGGTGVINRIQIGAYAAFGGGTLCVVDCNDAASCDTTGAAPMNDIHDEGRVFVSTASGDGDVMEWTPSAGAAWENVDDAAPDGNSTYISTGTVGHRALFTRPAITSTPTTIFGACVVNVVAKDDGGTATVAGMLKVNGTEYVGTGAAVTGATYVGVRDMFELNPDTGTPWASMAAWNAAQSGAKKVA